MRIKNNVAWLFGLKVSNFNVAIDLLKGIATDEIFSYLIGGLMSPKCVVS